MQKNRAPTTSAEHMASSMDELVRVAMERDRGLCVLCSAPAETARLILDGRLYPCGGLFLSNAASLCFHCARAAFITETPVSALRHAIGSPPAVLPPGFHDDLEYDRWGNLVIDLEARLPGMLFEHPEVQSAIAAAGITGMFTTRAFRLVRTT